MITALRDAHTENREASRGNQTKKGGASASVCACGRWQLCAHESRKPDGSASPLMSWRSACQVQGDPALRLHGGTARISSSAQHVLCMAASCLLAAPGHLCRQNGAFKT